MVLGHHGLVKVEYAILKIFLSWWYAMLLLTGEVVGTHSASMSGCVKISSLLRERNRCSNRNKQPGPITPVMEWSEVVCFCWGSIPALKSEGVSGETLLVQISQISVISHTKRILKYVLYLQGLCHMCIPFTWPLCGALITWAPRCYNLLPWNPVLSCQPQHKIQSVDYRIQFIIQYTFCFIRISLQIGSTQVIWKLWVSFFLYRVLMICIESGS